MTPLVRRAVRVVLVIAVSASVLACAGSLAVDSPEYRPDGMYATLTPGAALPSDRACAVAVERDAWEPRPENQQANRRTPGGPVSSRSWGEPRADALRDRVTGNFTGTTDEIIQWASCKWGFSTEITRAQADQESRWVQSARGDGGVSFGLMQIKSTYWTGTAPWSIDSTAYNLDWSLGLRRACFEGYMFEGRGRGDLWGCVGAHFSGLWRDPGALDYIEKVRGRLAERAWLTWPSRAGGSPPTG